MPSDDWRFPTAYDYLSDLTPPALAWEFLRRCPEYRAEYERMQGEDALGIVSEAASADLARRWGLRFCGRPAAPGRRSANLLAPRLPAIDRCPHKLQSD